MISAWSRARKWPVCGDQNEYVDLTAAFGSEEPGFADVWQLEVLPEGVFFLALKTCSGWIPQPARRVAGSTPAVSGAMARIDDKLSIGIAVVGADQQVDSVGVLEVADLQLHEIKRAGRNGVDSTPVGG